MIDRGCSTGDCAGVPIRMIRIEGKGPYPYCAECSEILTRMGDEDCGPFDPVTPEMIDRGAGVLRLMLGDVLGTDQKLHDMAEGVLRGALGVERDA